GLVAVLAALERALRLVPRLLLQGVALHVLGELGPPFRVLFGLELVEGLLHLALGHGAAAAGQPGLAVALVAGGLLLGELRDGLRLATARGRRDARGQRAAAGAARAAEPARARAGERGRATHRRGRAGPGDGHP